MPNVIYTGDLSKYVDRRIEGGEKAYREGGAHYAWRKNNLREGEKPHAVLIDSRQKQIEYCKAEGVQDPFDLTHVPAVSNDGKAISGRGLPGSW